MKVIVIEDSAAINGGAAKVAITAARGCAEAGLDVHFVAACGPIATELQGVDRLKVTCLDQQEIKNDPNRFRAVTKGIANSRAANAIRSILREADPDTVVHIHSFSKALSPLAVRAATQSGLPVVMSLHDYFTACPNGGFFNYQKNEICHLTPLSVSCMTCHCDSRSYPHKIWRVARALVQKRVLDVPACVKNFIILSPLARNVQTPFLPADATLYPLDNPIDAQDLGRAPVEQNKPILFVGRFSREKGVENLAKAIRDLGLPAVFVGDGHLRPEIEKMLPNAEFTGWLNSEGVISRIRSARMVAFPSTWYEVQPLVPIEAAANGVPSIVSNCTAAADYIPHNERGLHFQFDSVESLKEQLVASRDDRSLERMSQNAYSWYWSNPWTPQRHTRELMQIYEKMLNQRQVRAVL
jgi:glycosyltransferase involved in cell wall biosynthesis